MTADRSADLYSEARVLIPGGASSPARAFGLVGGDPMFAVRGEGAYVYDADGRAYVDFIQGFGAVILGHAHESVTDAVVEAARRGGALGLTTPDEVRLAELVGEHVRSVERIRFLASGTEAGMTAARIARAATGRPVILKFEGGYHGHADAFLAKAGSGVAAYAIPMAAGVPQASVADTLVLPYNDTGALEQAFAERGGEIAAVFVEPVAANMGVVLPDAGFLLRVLQLCREHEAVSVFDEVVTGFRVGLGGAQGMFDLSPDLTMLGKVLGGGLPIGAVGGRAELMELLAPTGSVFQAGTYASHPHAMAAGVAVLRELAPFVYDGLTEGAASLASGLEEAAREAGARATVVRAGTFLSVFFRERPPRSLTEAQEGGGEAFARFHRRLRAEGILIPPSPFEAWFPSLAHGAEEIERAVEASRRAFRDAATG